MSVLRALWNTRWVFLLALSLTLGWGFAGRTVVTWTTRFVLGPYGGESEARYALARLLELVTQNPELVAGTSAGTLLVALISWVAWTGFGGAVFLAARGDSFAASLRDALQYFGPLMAQGLAHAGLSAVGLLILSVALGPLPGPVRWLGFLAGICLSVLARDVVRAQICLHGLQRPYHPRATLRGFVYAFTHPREAAITTGLWTAKTAAALALPVIAIKALGPSSAAFPIRFVAVIGLMLAFVRQAWLIHWVPVELEPIATEGDADATQAD